MSMKTSSVETFILPSLSTFPNLLPLYVIKSILKKVNMTGRNWKGFSDDLYRDDVSIQNWNFESRDANYLMADFIWKLTGTADRHAPIKKLSPKEVKRRLNPWITPEIIKLIRVRDRLFTQKKRDPDNLLVKQAYNQARNRV